MHAYQKQFIEYAIEKDVLCFGSYTLKSGRSSPYFFNAGLFNDGEALCRLGEFYADAIIQSGVKFDVIFGPAYKGIPLVCAVAIALYHRHGYSVPWVFNRKEIKSHGEGGRLVGGDLQGRVLVIDDVITAGTAIRESLTLIDQAGATLAAVCVSIDRQERGSGEVSAIQEIEADYAASVITIARLETIIEYLQNDASRTEILKAIEEYRARYGVNLQRP